MQFYMYQKSHSEAPDIEQEVTLEYDSRCVARFRDDAEDTVGFPCGGRIEWKNNEDNGACLDCDTSYVKN